MSMTLFNTNFWQTVGAVSFVVMMFAVCLYMAMPCLTVFAQFGKWARRHHVQTLLIGVLVSVTAYQGMTKHGSITYPRTDPATWYLLDNGSYVTNNHVHIAFTRNVMVPTTANFFIDGLELSYTNTSDWATHSFNAYSNIFDRMSVPFDLPYIGASNYNWIAYTDWVPGPVVHTNGVAFVAWQIGVGQSVSNIVPTRTGVYVGPSKVSPVQAVTNGPAVIISTLNQSTED